MVKRLNSKRDKWVYSFSRNKLIENVKTFINTYNSDVERTKQYSNQEKLENITLNEKEISWSDELKRLLVKGETISFNQQYIVTALYRPFTKKYLYLDRKLIARPGRYKELFAKDNEIILTPGKSSRRSFSTLITNLVPDLNIMDAGAQGYYLYGVSDPENLFDDEKFNISEESTSIFGLDKLDIFYYVYGVLHSPEYREKYANNLNKSLPRIPVLKNKEKFVEIGKKLAELHLNYEHVPPYEGLEFEIRANPSYKVTRMKHPKKGVLDTIFFNNDITIKNIPEKAYEYVVNGKSAIEWIMDQYQIKTDKKSCITDDPNEYSDDEKYIFNLLLSIINVSVQTVDLVNSLPPLEIEA